MPILLSGIETFYVVVGAEKKMAEDNKKLSLMELYQKSLEKWEAITNMKDKGYYCGERCAFCEDNTYFDEYGDFNCYECKINHDICHVGGTKGIHGQMPKHTKALRKEFYAKMVEALKAEIVKLEEVEKK